MAVEIERKFLVINDGYRVLAEPVLYRQGYISTDTGRVVRVRVKGDKANITVKGATVGYSRLEYEYEIPLEDAEIIFSEICRKPIIEKLRYKVMIGSLVWDVDEYKGVNKGLVTAEIELDNERQQFDVPDWIGEEISHDHKYANTSLVTNPYCNWQKK